MTPKEARERIESIRIELRKCMRTVSVPDVDWYEVDSKVAGVQALVSDLRSNVLINCFIEESNGCTR